MTHTEALKLAIKALEHHVAQTRPIHSTSETIDALRAALECSETAHEINAAIAKAEGQT